MKNHSDQRGRQRGEKESHGKRGGVASCFWGVYIINKKRVVGDTKTRHTIPIGAGDSERSNGINQK
jgi:hypothetical protein